MTSGTDETVSSFNEQDNRVHRSPLGLPDAARGTLVLAKDFQYRAYSGYDTLRISLYIFVLRKETVTLSEDISNSKTK